MITIKTGDIVCTMLRCLKPLILRKTSVRGFPEFRVVGECYVHALMDGESLLGPIPSPWTVHQVQSRYNELLQPLYHNLETNTSTSEDPRLSKLSITDGWEKFEKDRSPDDPLFFVPYKNNKTGETINSDPRMFPDELRARGIKLEQFLLI